MRPTITALYLVKNEEEWLPLSVMTVVDHVDKVIIVDNGSTDETREVMAGLQWANPDKIETHGDETDFDHGMEYNVRNKWLARVTTDWVLPLDADQLLSDRWQKWVRGVMADKEYDAIRFRYEHYVGSFEHIHRSFYEKQHNNDLHPDVPLWQDVAFRMRPDLKWSPAAWSDPRFKEFHHASPGLSMAGRKFYNCGSATCFHYGFSRRNMMEQSVYRIQRGDYGHDQETKDKKIAELRASNNPFLFVGNVTKVDYGPEAVPSVIRHAFGKTYKLELDDQGFIKQRYLISTGETT